MVFLEFSKKTDKIAQIVDDTLRSRGSLISLVFSIINWYTSSISIHPKITGSYITQSFASDSNFTINNGTFSVNREFIFQDQIPVGMRNTVSKKIKNISFQNYIEI